MARKHQPDIITCAKGMTSGYAPIGAAIISDRLVEPFLDTGDVFMHGLTYGGHPVGCAVALANIDILEREDLPGRVLRDLLSPRLFELGLICRVEDKREPVIQLAPPLIAGPEEFREIGSILRTALSEASDIMSS